MTEAEDLKSKLITLHLAIFGTEGQGGLYREVESMRAQIDEHEKRLNAISVKWLVLMGVAGFVGNALSSSGLQALLKLIQ